MSVADEISKLAQLRDAGILTADEFERAKSRALGGDARTERSGVHPGSGFAPEDGLRRSTEDRWVGGVCGGLAAWTGVESWIWRLIFAVAFFVLGMGVLPYILLWIFVPLERSE